ncbi:type VI secretion system Vgr family protein [Tenacibaculum sp.]|uniref:type VI secretion system Vgr family protein n=1 Tax=Tenacibaculum sp. TaxID=1906242 RepID=UPI003D1447D7
MHKIKEEALDKQITIDGNFVKNYKEITVNQFLYKHHTFEIVLDIETVEESGSYTLDKSKEWLGKQLTTNVSGKAFVGVILDVSIRHDQVGLHGELVVRGLSQTVLLENGKQQKSWLEKDLESVVSEIIETTTINSKVKPSYTSTIQYQCQYGESDYKYLQRLAYQYNEWFYFDGVNIVFGKPDSEGEEPIELEYSKDLKELQIKAKTYTPTLATYSYDPLSDQFFEGDLKATNDGLNDLGNTALKASKEMYQEVKDFGVSDVFLQDKSSLDAYLEKRLQGITAESNVLKATGVTKGLRLGSLIKVSAAKYDEGEYTVKQYGEYIITQISHFANMEEDYYNTFEAIPASTKGLPLNQDITSAKASNQIAKVVSNQDPENKGRVQVQFFWQEANGETTDFIRVMTPDAGSSELTETNRGFVFVPEVGDQVMIGFEYDDPNRPFVMGSMFTGKTGAGGGDKNIKKSIVTRGGHTIELDDTQDNEKITIKDKDGSIITFDTKEKSLFVQSAETMEFSAKNVKIIAEENIELQAKGEIKTASEKDTSILSKGVIKAQADKDTSITSKANIAIKASSNTIIKGQNATIEGQASTELKGQQTKMQGQMTTVQGASGKIEIM